jgi:hypothetical protein
MNWKLDNLTLEQERAIDHYGYVGAFWSILLPRLLVTASPKTEPMMPPSTVAAQSANTYIPPAHRR